MGGGGRAGLLHRPHHRRAVGAPHGQPGAVRCGFLYSHVKLLAQGRNSMAQDRVGDRSKTEVDEHIHAAILKLAVEGGPRRLQSTAGDTSGLFPKGTAQAVKDALRAATTGEEPLLRVAGKEGRMEVYELTPAGMRVIGAAVAHTTKGMLAVDATRLAEQVMEKIPESKVELEPFVSAMEQRRAEEADREAKRRREDAEREAAVEDAHHRWREGRERRKRARIAELRTELAELGGSPPVVGMRPAPQPAPKDAKEFVRQEARRLVSAWADAVRLGRTEAERALEVVLGNLSAMKQVGEVGEATMFAPVHHECETAISTGAAVEVVRPGWVLVEEGQSEYVVAKARVQPRAR